MTIDPNSRSRQDLLLQRGEFHVLPPSRRQLPELHQVPGEWKVTIQRPVHRIHGRRRPPDALVRWHLRVP